MNSQWFFLQICQILLNLCRQLQQYLTSNISMDLFKRFGTDRHKFKVQFFLKKLACSAKLKGDVYIKIKRGDHKINSENKVSLEADGTCDFGRQILTFDALTLFFDPEHKIYQQKQVNSKLQKGQISVIIVTKTGDKKLLGTIQFDVAQWANSGKQNIQVTKQFGEKIKAMLQFDIFIKCLGEASQTSKSVDKNAQRKKQSSLSKFTSLFTGKQSPEKDKQQSPQQKKPMKKPAKDKQKQRQDSNPKNKLKDAEKVFKGKQDTSKEKNKDSLASTGLGKKYDTVGSQRKITDKGRKNKNDSEEDNYDGTPQKPSKNLVSVRQKDNFTQVEESEGNVKIRANKKNSTPTQQPIFFDQPASYKKPKNNEQQTDNKPVKMKRTENSAYVSAEPVKDVKDKQDAKKQNDIVKTTTKTQTKVDNLAQTDKVIKELKDKNSTLQKQNKELKTANSKLRQQNDNLEQKVSELMKKTDLDRDYFQTQRDGTYNNKRGDDQRVKNLEKQKGDLLVKIQKLEQKYKKDFQKYEQRVQQYQEQKVQHEEAAKAQIKRLKQQFSEQKDKYDKMMIKYEQKVNQSKQFKQKENDLKERLAVAQNNLSELKLKIGDKLNEANEDGNKTVIDILTLLSQ